MSRWLSPEKASRQAERAAKDAAQRRKVKRQSLMLIVGIAVVSVGLVVADYFWLRHQAKQRHEQRYRNPQRSSPTNDPASAAQHIELNRVTNHE